MAVADGYIAGADTRYHYNLWRPVTAIRAADTDGNDATTPDPAWESLLNTPALPDYPSTHSVCGGAAATVLARFFGSDEVTFTLPSGPPFAGQTRTYTSFSGTCREIGESRIYAGVHFRAACRDGIKLGKQIGRRTSLQYLLPSKDQ
jgi:membrane-associated phospholipid phosphatase